MPFWNRKAAKASQSPASTPRQSVNPSAQKPVEASSFLSKDHSKDVYMSTGDANDGNMGIHASYWSPEHTALYEPYLLGNGIPNGIFKSIQMNKSATFVTASEPHAAWVERRNKYGLFEGGGESATTANSAVITVTDMRDHINAKFGNHTLPMGARPKPGDKD